MSWWSILVKFFIGGVVVVGVTSLASLKQYGLSGVLALIPAISIVSYAIIAKHDGTEALRSVIGFSLMGLIPLCVFLSSLILLLKKYSFIGSLSGSLLLWFIFAWIVLRFAE